VTHAVIAAPLRLEWAAVRRARTTVVCTGMGPRRSIRSARRLGDAAAVLVAGVAGGLAPAVAVGDLVVASEVRAPDGTVRACVGGADLADRLRAAGLRVHYGPVLSWPRLVGGGQRRRLAATGALAVDMESAWLAPPEPVPFAVVRAVSDTVAAPLVRPGVVGAGLAALRALRRAVPALDAWADAATTASDVRKDALLTVPAQEGVLPDAETEVS
jgi:4-hydroxy-3-methylbut-2-enyl diphosphate reductase